MKNKKVWKNKTIKIITLIMYGAFLFDLFYFFLGDFGSSAQYLYLMTYLGPALSMMLLFAPWKTELTWKDVFYSNIRFIVLLLPGMFIWAGLYAMLYAPMLLTVVSNYAWIFIMCLFYGAIFYAIYKATGNTTYPVSILLFYTLNSISSWSPLLKDISYETALGKIPGAVLGMSLPYLVVIILVYGIAFVRDRRKKSLE